MARIAALVLVVVSVAMPAAATAAPRADLQRAAQPTPALDQPLQNRLEEVPQPAPAPAPTPQTEADSGSIGGGTLLVIALGILALIGGIWFAIARDARRATSGRPQPAAGQLSDNRGGSATRAGRRSRKLSAAERQRRKRGRAR